MRYVPGIGPSNAKLMIVGEAPGANEEMQGLPFVGATGKMVDEFLRNAGVKREEVYLTNVVKYRPPNNNINMLYCLEGKTVDEYIPQLWEEIDTLKPNCILALGNTALKGLTGMQGIEKYRGSILKTIRGYPKVVPTLHPASLMHKEADGKMRSWGDRVFIQWDFNRAVQQSKFQEINRPYRNIIIAKSSMDVMEYFQRNEGKRFAAVDIETFKTIPICIGIAFSRTEAISIPLFNLLSDTNIHGITRTDMLYIWQEVAKFVSDPNILKIGQNFKYDETQLSTPYNRAINFGMACKGVFFDTHLAFRTLYPELPASLGFITSVLTEEPYYKDEGKEYNPKKDKLDVLLKYNAKDAYTTFEAFEEMTRELQERGLEDFFFSRVMPLHPFYKRMEGIGLKRDKFQQRFLSEKYKDREEQLQDELNTLTTPFGVECVNVASNGPKNQVAKLLYGAMSLPLRGGTDEKTLDALMRNSVKDPIKRRIVELILEVRKVRKTRGTYVDAQAHPDDRIRSSFKIMLETGRTSSSVCKAPVTTEKMGLAFQTITKHGDVGADIRGMFVPDEGYVFLEPDLSGAEARVVALLASDAKMLKMFEYNVDIHRMTYSWIVGNTPNSLVKSFFEVNEYFECTRLAGEINKILKGLINDEDRQIGKKFRHAGNYDMGKRTAAINAAISELRSGKILKLFHETNPSIQGVFHKGIQEALRDNNRTLVNPFGRQRQFYNKWGDELFKEAYAQIPQSTISDQTKFAAQRIEKRAPYLRIVMESHDSFLAMCPIRDVDKCIPIIKEEMESPIDFSNCTLPRGTITIPSEIKLGDKSWLEMKVIA